MQRPGALSRVLVHDGPRRREFVALVHERVMIPEGGLAGDPCAGTRRTLLLHGPGTIVERLQLRGGDFALPVQAATYPLCAWNSLPFYAPRLSMQRGAYDDWVGTQGTASISPGTPLGACALLSSDAERAMREIYGMTCEYTRHDVELRALLKPALDCAACHIARPLEPERRMDTRDPRIDAYIEKAAPFARPILTHLREVVHKGCPDVEETMKWSMPHFMHHGMMAGMAAFKQHCTFGFWRGGQLLGDRGKEAKEDGESAMGQFGRITSLRDLPPKRELEALVRRAAKLNEDVATGKAKVVTKKRPARAALPVPEDLARALRANPRARNTFDAFPPSHRREYVEWIVEAKRAETRERRVQTAVEWLTEGKSRNWKYVK